MTAFKYLLDTNIISDLIRNPYGRAAQHLAEKGEKWTCTSIIVASELRFGAARKQSQALETRVEVILRGFKVLPFKVDADRHYAEIRSGLERAGTPIGSNDLLIAAQARSLGLVLVTANVKEFLRVPDLAIENWL